MFDQKKLVFSFFETICLSIICGSLMQNGFKSCIIFKADEELRSFYSFMP